MPTHQRQTPYRGKPVVVPPQGEGIRGLTGKATLLNMLATITPGTPEYASEHPVAKIPANHPIQRPAPSQARVLVGSPSNRGGGWTLDGKRLPPDYQFPDFDPKKWGTAKTAKRPETYVDSTGIEQVLDRNDPASVRAAQEWRIKKLKAEQGQERPFFMADELRKGLKDRAKENWQAAKDDAKGFEAFGGMLMQGLLDSQDGTAVAIAPDAQTRQQAIDRVQEDKDRGSKQAGMVARGFMQTPSGHALQAAILSWHGDKKGARAIAAAIPGELWTNAGHDPFGAGLQMMGFMGGAGAVLGKVGAGLSKVERVGAIVDAAVDSGRISPAVGAAIKAGAGRAAGAGGKMVAAGHEATYYATGGPVAVKAIQAGRKAASIVKGVLPGAKLPNAAPALPTQNHGPIIQTGTIAGSSEGVDPAALDAAHHNTFAGVGYDPKTGQIQAFNDAGINHRVLSTNGYSSTALWGLEPNAYIDLPGASLEYAKAVASMMGLATDQDAMGIHLPISPEEVAAAEKATKLGLPLPDLVHPIATITKKSGLPFTRQETENLGTIAAKNGIELQTSPDRTSMEFHNYYGDPHEWANNVDKVFNDDGLNTENYNLKRGYAKSDYIQKDAYSQLLGLAADRPEQSGGLGAAGQAYARSHEESYRDIEAQRADRAQVGDSPPNDEPPPAPPPTQPAVPPSGPPANAGGSSDSQSSKQNGAGDTTTDRVSAVYPTAAPGFRVAMRDPQNVSHLVTTAGQLIFPNRARTGYDNQGRPIEPNKIAQVVDVVGRPAWDSGKAWA